MIKIRLDKLMIIRQLVDSRQQGKILIKDGRVKVNNKVIKDASKKFELDSEISIDNNIKYVSRGGVKLDEAINVFKIKIEKSICLDIGASTGGFTDCMLTNGAKKIYAVDVGKGQLHKKLLANPKIINMERVNARYLNIHNISEKVDFAAVDVSFISVKLILSSLKKILKRNCLAVVLVKPEFEMGEKHFNKNGVVRQSFFHKKILKDIVLFCNSIYFSPINITPSPITGPKGNIEYLLLLKNEQIHSKINEKLIEDIVNKAHLKFKNH